MTSEAAQIQARSFDVPDETRDAAGAGRIEIVRLGRTTWARGTILPGFRWSEHLKPLAGTELCQIPHTGYVVSGRAMVEMADGARREMAAGDVFDIPAGHDMWVVGDEPYVSIDFTPVEDPEDSWEQLSETPAT